MFLSILTCLLFGAIKPDPSSFSERIEVKVGSAIIATTDIDMLTEAMKDHIQNESSASLRQKARDTLIDQSLMSIYLQEANFPITDKEIDQRINSIRSSNGIQSEAQFRALLESKGLNFDAYRAQMKLQMERAQFVNVVRRQVARSIGDEEIRSYFKSNPEKFKRNLEIDLAECLIPFGSDPQDAKLKAENFVNNPEQFNICVKKLSQGASAAKSGFVGTFRHGVLPDEVESKVFHLKKGEVALVRQPQAFQLLKVLKIKDLGAFTLDMVKDSIRDQLENELAQKEIEKKLSDLKARTFVKIEEPAKDVAPL